MTIRAEHVGSLLRPERLVEARAEYEAGRLSITDLRDIEDNAIRAALDGQANTGVTIFTDGEFRRAGFVRGFMDAVGGFTQTAEVKLPWRGGSGSEPESANVRVVAERLAPTKRIARDEAIFMAEASPGLFKITLPSPLVMCETGWRRGMSDAAYADPRDLLEGIAEILTREVEDLALEEVSYIQLDNPAYTHFVDESTQAAFRGYGIDLDSLLEAAIAADNAVLDAARAKNVMTGVHLCRGNSMGRWVAEGGYDRIAERLFGELRCDRLLLEYDTDRAGSFAPLRFLPDSKIAVLGLVTTKSPEMETLDGLKRRFDEAIKYASAEQLAVSPQCGFASSGAGNPIGEREQWAKLALIVELAEDLWQDA